MWLKFNPHLLWTTTPVGGSKSQTSQPSSTGAAAHHVVRITGAAVKSEIPLPVNELMIYEFACNYNALNNWMFMGNTSLTLPLGLWWRRGPLMIRVLYSAEWDSSERMRLTCSNTNHFCGRWLSAAFGGKVNKQQTPKLEINYWWNNKIGYEHPLAVYVLKWDFRTHQCWALFVCFRFFTLLDELWQKLISSWPVFVGPLLLSLELAVRFYHSRLGSFGLEEVRVSNRTARIQNFADFWNRVFIKINIHTFK